jgi:hypothetical protein
MYSRRQRLPGDSKHQIIDEGQIEEKFESIFSPIALTEVTAALSPRRI